MLFPFNNVENYVPRLLTTIGAENNDSAFNSAHNSAHNEYTSNHTAVQALFCAITCHIGKSITGKMVDGVRLLVHLI
jgi:hypothetical protein